MSSATTPSVTLYASRILVLVDRSIEATDRECLGATVRCGFEPMVGSDGQLQWRRRAVVAVACWQRHASSIFAGIQMVVEILHGLEKIIKGNSGVRLSLSPL